MFSTGEYLKKGNPKKDGMGYSAEYSLANNAYWYVNKYEGLGLGKTIEGFKVVPYPYIATLGALPVANAYTGDNLFTVNWNADGTIAGVNADAVTGATVSTSNITSMLQGLFKYHVEHYHK